MINNLMCTKNKVSLHSVFFSEINQRIKMEMNSPYKMKQQQNKSLFSQVL